MPQKRTRRKAERRSRPRADARLSMRLEGAPDGHTAQIVTESHNISSSGVYCTCAHFLAPLSKVALTIVLPRLPGTRQAKELIKCDGIVVRCQPASRKGEKQYELACMFSGLDERRRILLDDFVAWRNLQALRAATQPAGGARASRTRPATSKARTRTRTAVRRRTAH